MTSKVAEVSWSGRQLKCSCGQDVNIADLYDSIASELDVGYSDSIEDSEVFICGSCGCKHEVTLELEVEVNVAGSSVTSLNESIYGKNNELIPESYFHSLYSGSAAELLWDGEYELDGKVYRIVDGKVLYVLSAQIDENQMDIFDFEEVLA